MEWHAIPLAYFCYLFQFHRKYKCVLNCWLTFAVIPWLPHNRRRKRNSRAFHGPWLVQGLDKSLKYLLAGISAVSIGMVWCVWCALVLHCSKIGTKKRVSQLPCEHHNIKYHINRRHRTATSRIDCNLHLTSSVGHSVNDEKNEAKNPANAKLHVNRI